MIVMLKRQTLIAWIALVAITVMPFSALAQGRKSNITATNIVFRTTSNSGARPRRKLKASFHLLRDETVRSYVENVGRRLVAAIPSEFQHSEFQYYFKVVNARDINAFALPGGPMYVNRGMIEAARS